jgi:DNA-binding SARP family transcriptional activator
MTCNKPLLCITSFGGLSISVLNPDGTEADMPVISDSEGHSRKLWTLIGYLLFSGRDKVPAEDLIEILWPENDSLTDPLGSLRLLVHRARAQLNGLACYKGSELILCGNGAYSWNRRVAMKLDTERFELLCRSTAGCRGAKHLNTVLEAIAIYRERFLPKLSCQQWAMALDTYYNSKYTVLCLEAVELLRPLGRYRDIIDICTKAVVLTPFTEQLHISLVEALTAVGSYKEAMSHYKFVKEMLINDLNIAPSEKLQAVYRVLSRNAQAMESNIDMIRKTLTCSKTVGPFYCDFELFKQIYELKSRECLRSGEMIQLSLITILPGRGKTPGMRSRNAAMERLDRIIRASLRMSDVYTRFSTMQYLLLLQATNYENGEVALERIRRNYKKSAARTDYLFQCSLLPILPSP